MRVGVALFDDGFNLAVRVPHDSAEALWARRFQGKQGDAVGIRERDQIAQGVRAHQRHVAVKHEYEVRIYLRHGLLNGMTGAELPLLQHPVQAAIAGKGEIGGFEGLTHEFGAMADDRVNPGMVERCRRFEYVGQQGLAAEAMQRLGQRTEHAGALAGGENDDLKFHSGAGLFFQGVSVADQDRSFRNCRKARSCAAASAELHGGGGIFEFGVLVGDRPLGVLEGLVRGGLVDVIGARRGVGEQRHRLRLHFQKTAGNVEHLFRAVFEVEPHRAGQQVGQQRGVAGRDAELAHVARNDHERHFTGENAFLRADDVALNGFGH